MMGYKYSGGGDSLSNVLAEKTTMNTGMKSRMFSSFTNNDVIMEEDEETYRPSNQKSEATPYPEDEYHHIPNHLESRFDHVYSEEERMLNEEDLKAFAHIALQDQPLSIFDHSPRDEAAAASPSMPKKNRQKIMVR